MQVLSAGRSVMPRFGRQLVPNDEPDLYRQVQALSKQMEEPGKVQADYCFVAGDDWCRGIKSPGLKDVAKGPVHLLRFFRKEFASKFEADTEVLVDGILQKRGDQQFAALKTVDLYYLIDQWHDTPSVIRKFMESAGGVMRQYAKNPVGLKNVPDAKLSVVKGNDVMLYRYRIPVEAVQNDGHWRDVLRYLEKQGILSDEFVSGKLQPACR